MPAIVKPATSPQPKPRSAVKPSATTPKPPPTTPSSTKIKSGPRADPTPSATPAKKPRAKKQAVEAPTTPTAPLIPPKLESPYNPNVVTPTTTVRTSSTSVMVPLVVTDDEDVTVEASLLPTRARDAPIIRLTIDGVFTTNTIYEGKISKQIFTITAKDFEHCQDFNAHLRFTGETDVIYYDADIDSYQIVGKLNYQTSELTPRELKQFHTYRLSGTLKTVFLQNRKTGEDQQYVYFTINHVTDRMLPPNVVPVKNYEKKPDDFDALPADAAYEQEQAVRQSGRLAVAGGGKRKKPGFVDDEASEGEDEEDDEDEDEEEEETSADLDAKDQALADHDAASFPLSQA